MKKVLVVMLLMLFVVQVAALADCVGGVGAGCGPAEQPIIMIADSLPIRGLAGLAFNIWWDWWWL
jgi:hypothetical protein